MTLDESIAKRIKDMRDWIDADAPGIETEQKHLDDGTPERAYWHYGYLMALLDIQRLRRS